MHRRVPAIVRRVQEVEIRIEQCSNCVQIAIRDGVAQGSERGLLVCDSWEVGGRVFEDRGVELGHLASDTGLHLLDYVFVCEVGDLGKQVGELCQRGFGGEVVAEDYAGSA